MILSKLIYIYKYNIINTHCLFLILVKRKKKLEFFKFSELQIETQFKMSI